MGLNTIAANLHDLKIIANFVIRIFYHCYCVINFKSEICKY